MVGFYSLCFVGPFGGVLWRGWFLLNGRLSLSKCRSNAAVFAGPRKRMSSGVKTSLLGTRSIHGGEFTVGPDDMMMEPIERKELENWTW